MDLPATGAAAGAGAARVADLVDGGDAVVDEPADFLVGGDVAETDEHGDDVELNLVFKSKQVKIDLKEGFEVTNISLVSLFYTTSSHPTTRPAVRPCTIGSVASSTGGKRARRACAACAIAAAALCGCSQETKTPAPDGVVVTLLEAGREPRQALRYPSSPTPAHRMSLGLRLSMKMEVPGSPVPPIDMPGLRLLFDVQSARDGERIRYQLKLSDADLTGTDNAHPSLLAEMRKGVGLLVGASGQLEVDPRGQVSGLSLAQPSGLGSELAQFLNSARLAMDDMVVPLPEEPIGIGAKWEAIDTVTQGGISVREKTYFELVALDGPRALVRTRMVLSADRQRAALPGLPDGVTAEVVSLRGSGTGEIELDLRRLVPGNAREEIDIDISFVVRQGQTERAMSLTSESGLEIQAL